MSRAEIMRLYEKGIPRIDIVEIFAKETIVTQADAEKIVNEIILTAKKRK